MFWYAQIQRYTSSSWSNELHLCPSFRGREYDTPPYSDLRYSYGYNAHGTGFDHGPFGLGLGGRLLSAPHVPVPESGVAAPSEMIALGDGYASGISAGTVSLIGDQGWIGNHLRGGVGLPGWEKAATARHRGKLGVAFCDGHVEGDTIKSPLYDMTESAMKRWNNDNQAHLELY